MKARTDARVFFANAAERAACIAEAQAAGLSLSAWFRAGRGLPALAHGDPARFGAKHQARPSAGKPARIKQ